MSATLDETAKLAFAKYLLSLAGRHLDMPEPLASVGLLLLHDATEHHLVLCCYKVNEDPRKTDFLGYWKLIDGKRAPQVLPEKGRMAAFNDARVALKHRGIQPSRAQLREFENLVLGFFDTVLSDIFGLSLAAVNLVAFVSNEAARNQLELTSKALHEARYGDAVAHAAYAFDDIREISPLGKGWDRFDAFLRLPPAPHIMRDEYNTDRQAHEFFESVVKCLESLRESISVLSLGIDFARFVRFKAIVPETVTFSDGNRKQFDRRRNSRNPHTLEEAEFCMSFVIDSAFQIQEQPASPT